MFKSKELEEICGNCEHLDMSMRTKEYPPKYKCKYYNTYMTFTSRCVSSKTTYVDLDLLPPVLRYDIFDESE